MENLKNQNNKLINIINKTSTDELDELLHIDPDIFEYDSGYILKNKVIYYEKQLYYVNEFLNSNNISNFEKLTEIINFYENNNNNNSNTDVLNVIENKEEYIRPMINSMSKDEIIQTQNQINNSLEKIKNKLSRIKEGDIITVRGIKRKAIIIKDKLKFVKIENLINKIKMVQEEFDIYCDKQIQWAKEVLKNDIDDNKIINLLDILNKLHKSYISIKSDSEGEISDIFNDMENIEVQRYNTLFRLGNSFIKNDISDKSQISDIIKNYKKIIYSYDSKDKINRFISTSKRMYKISKLINTENIIKSKCMTSIRDMSNKDFDNLLTLLENKNKNQQ
jgi:ElaB/YqjD/DUF883 family membrane-anchored ribosome-binding protein